MKLKLLLIILVILGAGFAYLGVKDSPVTAQTVETKLPREQFLP